MHIICITHIQRQYRIKFKSKNNFERNIIRKAELQLVNKRIRDNHNKIEHLGTENQSMKKLPKNSLNNDNVSTQVEQFLFQSKEKPSNLLKVLKLKK